MVAPPPGRFATIIDWPSCAETDSNTMRGMTSVALPAVNGTITRIGLVGQDCARDCARLGATAASTAAAASAVQDAHRGATGRVMPFVPGLAFQALRSGWTQARPSGRPDSLADAQQRHHSGGGRWLIALTRQLRVTTMNSV